MKSCSQNKNSIVWERGDHKKEREKCYDIVALRSRLFPLENLLTRGLINLKIWKNEQHKKSDSKMLKICDLYLENKM